MFSLSTVIALFALCVKISLTASLNKNPFYKTSGPFFVSKEAVNWTDAKIGCKNAGLELVSIISQEERTALNIFITENDLIPEDKWSGYWLSGIRHDDGKYYWDTTETEVDSSVQSWAWGEPSHAYGRENCVELKWDQISLGLNDYFCDEARRYICQVSRKLKPKTVKNILQKQQYQKKWLSKESDIYDSTQVTEINKEPEDYGPEATIDMYPDYVYLQQSISSNLKLLYDDTMESDLTTQEPKIL